MGINEYTLSDKERSYVKFAILRLTAYPPADHLVCSKSLVNYANTLNSVWDITAGIGLNRDKRVNWDNAHYETVISLFVYLYVFCWHW